LQRKPRAPSTWRQCPSTLASPRLAGLAGACLSSLQAIPTHCTLHPAAAPPDRALDTSQLLRLQGSLALRLCLPRSRSGLVLAPLAVIDICIRLALPPKPASESATQPTTTRQAAERPAADHHHDAALPSRESRISHLRAPGQVAPDRPLVALRTARRRPSLLSYRHPPARPSRTRTHTCAPAANCPPALRKAPRSRATLWRACLPAPECL
jgi:septal ring-binding cell division protein DamX